MEIQLIIDFQFSADNGFNWLSFDLPIRQGTVSEGGYSFDINSKGDIVVVGGDYTEQNAGKNSCCISLDKGLTWNKPNNFPLGYRSCVQYMNDSILVSVGTSGLDYSTDNGFNWNSLDTTYNLNVIKFVNDSIGYAAGNGEIIKIWK